MSKLFFRYGAMNSGKSTGLLQVAHNYEERNQAVILVKPVVDTKGGAQVVSRLNVTRDADIVLGADEDLRQAVHAHRSARPATANPIACVLIDEAQFLSPEQVDQAMTIAVLDDIAVLAYGIRTDFQTRAFPGSRRLLEIAHNIEEMKTICRCGSKAIFNARLTDDGIAKEGSQVLIDQEGVSYEALCGRCYLLAARTGN